MSDYALLLPGAGSSADFMCRRFPAHLLGVQRLVAIGYTGSCEDELVEGVARLMRRLGPPAVSCGVSVGAHLAVALSLRVPPVRRLALLLPAGLRTGQRPAHGLPAAQGASTATRASVPAWSRDAALDHVATLPQDWVTWELQRAWRTLRGADVAASLELGRRSAGPSAGELARIEVPTTIVALSDDPLHPLDIARSWSQLVPRAELVSLTRQDVERDALALARAAIGSR